jgi:formylglycine-generating enzyme required for sulfatase activity
MVPRAIRSAVPVLPLVAFLTLLSSAVAEPQGGKKYALLVGVNQYEHADLPPLGYAVADVTQLRDVLARVGYEVVLLTADEARARKDQALAPTRANVEAHLKALVRKFAKGDTLLIGLAGHGLQFAGDEDGYFCPQGARPFKERTDTLVSVKWVYQRLHQDAADGVKLLLVDACRSIPKVRGRGIDADGVPAPPKGVGMLLSCAAGQQAFEGADWGGGHGVFFHYVLEGLKGKAADDEGAVTWDSLRSFVKRRVTKDLAGQTPEESGRLAGAPPVLIDPAALGAAKRIADKAAKELVVDLGGGVRMKFVRIPAGSFRMGGDKYDDEKPVHRVTITKGFYMGVYPVTQGQWQKVMGDNPSHFKGDDNCPVEQVSWEDCQKFCEKLRQRDGRPYRLPTEAEWEHACRAETTTEYYTGDGEDALKRAGWYLGNSDRKTHPAGKLAPNKWGLYDMHGNVWQWCQDWYGPYPTGDVEDQKGPSKGEYRVLRGGSWGHFPEHCRAAYRLRNAPADRYGNAGCRVCFRLD